MSPEGSRRNDFVRGQTEGLEVSVEHPIAREVPPADDDRDQDHRRDAHERGPQLGAPPAVQRVGTDGGDGDERARKLRQDREAGGHADRPGAPQLGTRPSAGAIAACEGEDGEGGEERGQHLLAHHGAHVDVRGEEEQ